MIEFMKFRPNPRAPKLVVTNPARICSIRAGIVEVTMVCSRTNPRGMTIYEEAGTILWPVEALVEAHREFHTAFKELLRRELAHHRLQ